VLLTNISLVVGEFVRTGGLGYPPRSELRFSPGVGVDDHLWALQISGVGTLMTGINFTTTILKIRATRACRYFVGPRWLPISSFVAKQHLA
jgi:cytochrome o ubiquinol oxidase subunit I